jgi:hypothetical protein
MCNTKFHVSVQDICDTLCYNWLQHCATGRKSTVSVPDVVASFFQFDYPSSHIMALEWTKPLTEMSTRNLLVGKRRPVPMAGTSASSLIRFSVKCLNLVDSKPYGPPRSVTVIALRCYLCKLFVTQDSNIVWTYMYNMYEKCWYGVGWIGVETGSQAWRFHFSAVDIGKGNWEIPVKKAEKSSPVSSPMNPLFPLHTNKEELDDMSKERGMCKKWRSTIVRRNKGNIYIYIFKCIK